MNMIRKEKRWMYRVSLTQRANGVDMNIAHIGYTSAEQARERAKIAKAYYQEDEPEAHVSYRVRSYMDSFDDGVPNPTTEIQPNRPRTIKDRIRIFFIDPYFAVRNCGYAKSNVYSKIKKLSNKKFLALFHQIYGDSCNGYTAKEFEENRKEARRILDDSRLIVRIIMEK